MRWDSRDIDRTDENALPGLARLHGLVRSVTTPEFAGVTFHEVAAKSALNKVPGESHVPFRWTINPYRGCSHACVYCLSGDTPILMGDGRVKPLSDVRVGDEVIGTRRDGRYRRYVRTPVLHQWATTKLGYEVRLTDGTTLVASGDHRFLTWRGWKYVVGTEHGGMRRPHLTLADRFLGVGRLADPPKDTADYRLGYLAGMIRGDGHVGSYTYARSGRRTAAVHRFRLALVDEEALDRTSRYLASIGVVTTRFAFSPASEKRRAVHAIRTSARHAVELVRTAIAWPAPPSQNWRKGFLAGIFDAEGSHSQGVLRITNTDPRIIDEVTAALDAGSFSYAIEDRHLANGLRTVRIKGGLRERLRFFHTTGPAITRKLDIDGVAVKGNAGLQLASIRSLGIEVPMIDITTGTGDFIANGVVSHNCFARGTHTYLDLDPGDDFDRQVVVKVNVAEVLRRELARPSWEREHVAMGTNTDPYQRAEGRYRLMPGVINALVQAHTPFSVLTKGTLLRRDLPALSEAAQVVDVGVAVSLALLDPELHRTLEPGTPTPRARLELVAAIRAAGLPCTVLIAPVLPWLTDSAEQLESLAVALADAGTTGASIIPPHLRPGTRPWFMRWLAREHPRLVSRYEQLYGRRAYVPEAYASWLRSRAGPILAAHGLNRRADHRSDRLPGAPAGGDATRARPLTDPAAPPALF